MGAPHYLELTGDAHTCGRIHGGELRQEVAACVDFYLSILGLEKEELGQRAALFERLIEAYSPSQAEEIRGIAAGAGLPPAHVFAINARSELVPFSVSECTALCSPREGLLAQTWDWCEQLQELITLLAITREDGHRILTVTEPGIVGKIGLYTEVPAGEMEANSRARIDRAQGLLSAAGSPVIGDLKAILSNRDDEDAPICAPYHASGLP